MGVGHFFGLMPEALCRAARRTGVELDCITARIAQQLYPDSTIFAKGFEETPLPDNYFDAVVGNIPFGNYPVSRSRLSPQPGLTRAIHDYFFAKSLDKLRPGGVMALITSRYTMDKQDATIRRYLAERADLLGAIRLPNTAFKANAGTEVTTDILFLQKRAPGAPARGEAWRELDAIDTPDGPIAVNEYFARHPEMMLGKMRLEGTMYRGGEPTLAGELTPERSRQAPSHRCPTAFTSRATQGRAPRRHRAGGDRRIVSGVKDGAFAERDGAHCHPQRRALRTRQPDLGSAAARVRGMLAVRDAVRLVFQTQLDDAPEERITEARKLLNAVYDSFVAPVRPALLPREHQGLRRRPRPAPAALARKLRPRNQARHQDRHFRAPHAGALRPVEHVETAAEALAVSLNETGEINWPRMEQLTGRSPQAAAARTGQPRLPQSRKAANGRPPTAI